MTFYASFVIALAIMGWLCVRATANISRLFVISLFVMLTVAAPFVYWDTLSRPKSVTDQFRVYADVKVLSYHAIPGKALFLLIKIPDIWEPRYFIMDWSESAEKLTQELQDGFEAEQEMAIKNLFEPSLETERKAYPMPPERLPEKEIPAAPDQHRTE